MTSKVKMEALMTLPKTADRDAVKRGVTFETSEQEARDLERMERAVREPGKAGDAKKASA